MSQALLDMEIYIRISIYSSKNISFNNTYMHIWLYYIIYFTYYDLGSLDIHIQDMDIHIQDMDIHIQAVSVTSRDCPWGMVTNKKAIFLGYRYQYLYPRIFVWHYCLFQLKSTQKNVDMDIHCTISNQFQLTAIGPSWGHLWWLKQYPTLGSGPRYLICVTLFCTLS